jgi:hypothetical protein
MTRRRAMAKTACAGGSLPRLALTRHEAASALGMSINSFERHVQPELRLVRRGKLRLIPVREIERWLTENSDPALDEAAGF